MANAFISINEIYALLCKEKSRNPSLMKAESERLIEKNFSLRKERSVFVGDGYALRFSEVRGESSSFSNVVLSLSALKKYDENPFIVIIVRQDSIEFLLSNTSFLKKISHSSHTLSMTNIKGSFLGHDIMSSFNQIKNQLQNFESLFKEHKKIGWVKNLSRLVEKTDEITGTGIKYIPNHEETKIILSSPERTKKLLANIEFIRTKSLLNDQVRNLQSQILLAASDQNINTRGNTIEQLITSSVNRHETEDIEFFLKDRSCLKIDIKTKLAGLSSNPKAFNIDKLLKELSKPTNFFFYFFVYIDQQNKSIKTRLLSIFDKSIIVRTRTQHHWAGRNSRGATQLSGEIIDLLEDNYNEVIDIPQAELFLKSLLE
jgi:hypothetical protein